MVVETYDADTGEKEMLWKSRCWCWLQTGITNGHNKVLFHCGHRCHCSYIALSKG